MALTRDRAGSFFKSSTGNNYNYAPQSPLIGTGVTIYKFAAVSRNAAGYLIPAADTASTVFVGVAIDGTNGKTVSGNGVFSDGTVAKSRVVSQGTVLMNMTGAAQTDVDQTAMIVDDNTVALAATTTNDIPMGKIIELGSAANTVWVAFNTLRQ